MVEILKEEYWSKSEAFLLPLTGLSKTQKYNLKAYLFWDRYSIENYELIIKFTYDNYNEFLHYCRRIIFPILDRNGYLVETHDFGHDTIMVLDISEWALDIEMFLGGKYSKMSKEAKGIITEYHTFYDDGPKVMIEIIGSLEPNVKFGVLGNMTPIDYVAENYGLPLVELRKVGEIGGIYNAEKETLVLKSKVNESIT